MLLSISKRGVGASKPIETLDGVGDPVWGYAPHIQTLVHTPRMGTFTGA